MIGHLRGTLVGSTPSRILLDVHGVGYELDIPLSTYYELQKAPGDAPLGLHVHTHVREDAIVLYGFWTLAERGLFEKLIAISGIGPRLAQTVLSGMSPGDLVAAIAAGDLRRLSSIPGIGKKTAERMVLELKDKVGDLDASPQAPRTAGDDDVVEALVQLGYKPGVAERALAKVAAEQPGLGATDQLRAALKQLSRA